MPHKRYRLPQVAFFQGCEAAARNGVFSVAQAGERIRSFLK